MSRNALGSTMETKYIINIKSILFLKENNEEIYSSSLPISL